MIVRAVVLLVSLIVFLIGLRWLPPDARARHRAAERSRRQTSSRSTERLTREERRTGAALFMVAFCNIFFWGCYGQQYSTIALMAQNNTDLSVGPLSFRPEDVQSFNPFFIFTLTPLVIAFWAWQAKRGREPAPVTKMAIGCTLTAACFGLLILPSVGIDRGAHPTVLWIVAALSMQTIGELYLSPVGLSLFSRTAPAKYMSVMMAVNFMSLSIGFYLSGYLASFWSSMEKTTFFTMIASIALGAAIAIFALSRILNPMLDREREVALTEVG